MARKGACGGAITFRAAKDRATTFANLLAALELPPADNQFTEDVIADFLGVGLGHLLLTALSDAMEHENLLESKPFWDEIQQALAATQQERFDAASPPYYAHLQSAATRLLAARERLYPVAIHLLDFVLLEEQNFHDPWPITVGHGQPINVIASSSVLVKLQSENAEAVKSLADAMLAGMAEVCGGGYLEREDALLPIESQLWNLAKGQAVARASLGQPVHVYARRRFGAYPQLPTWLNQHGMTKAILLPLNDTGLPAYSSPVMNWTTQDGQQIDCFVRKPLATDSVNAFFNLGHFWFKTTREDHAATLAFLHGKGAALPWYGDLLALTRLAPVAGRFATATTYFGETPAGEHAGALEADNFSFDYLSERVPAVLFPRRCLSAVSPCMLACAAGWTLAGRWRPCSAVWRAETIPSGPKRP